MNIKPQLKQYFAKSTNIIFKPATIVVFFLVLGIIFAINYNSNPSGVDLLVMWNNYKQKYVDKSGRTIDEQSEGITTSEGQSYTMLRSVWSNDKAIFDLSWDWTKNNLGRANDNLFSWKWGKKNDSSFGVITQSNGQNSAIDGDIDIAYSLILASKKWNNPSYLENSKLIIQDIWQKAVVQADSGRLILASNDIEKQYNKNLIVVNPSYFSTYAFHLFANVTPELAWNSLADDCYFFLEKILDTKLLDKKLTVLPPDWIIIDKKTLEILPPQNKNLTFGYDAFRIPWRISLDYNIYRDPKAKQLLSKLSFLSKEYQNKDIIYTSYDITGTVQEKRESLFGYSNALAYFDIIEPSKSKSIVNSKIIPRLSNNMSYYDDNWTWFGLALHQKIIFETL